MSSGDASQALTLGQAARLMAGQNDEQRWRLVAEFLEGYRWRPIESRSALLEEEPAATGDDRWDAFLAALAEHVTAREGRGAPRWAQGRVLDRFWFPFDSPAARADAYVHAPAAFRRRGIFVAPQELEVA